jgi:alpha-beta hydrolase superfamily lysophospholipase
LPRRPVRSIRRRSRTVATRVRYAQPTGPLILIGHSMGGAIALAYTIRHQQHLDGLVLSGPASTRGRSWSILDSARIEVLSRLVPHKRLPPLPSSAISRDAAVVAAYDGDPLVTRNGPTVRLRRELRRPSPRVPRKHARHHAASSPSTWRGR